MCPRLWTRIVHFITRIQIFGICILGEINLFKSDRTFVYWFLKSLLHCKMSWGPFHLTNKNILGKNQRHLEKMVNIWGLWSWSWSFSFPHHISFTSQIKNHEIDTFHKLFFGNGHILSILIYDIINLCHDYWAV